MRRKACRITVPSEARKACGGPAAILIPTKLISFSRDGKTLKIELGRHKVMYNGKEITVNVIAA